MRCPYRDDVAACLQCPFPDCMDGERGTVEETQIGYRLREIRLKLGMSQREVGEIVGVAPNTVGKWERGVAMPSEPHIAKLCAEFPDLDN